MSKIRILWECNSLALQHNIFLQISPFLADANSHFYKQGWGLQGRGKCGEGNPPSFLHCTSDFHDQLAFSHPIFCPKALRVLHLKSAAQSSVLPEKGIGDWEAEEQVCRVSSVTWLKGFTQCPWSLGSFLLHFLLLTQARGTRTPRCKVRGKVTAPSRCLSDFLSLTT